MKVYCKIKMPSGRSGSKERLDKLCPERVGLHYGCCCYCPRDCTERCRNNAKVCGLLLAKRTKKEKIDG